MARSARRKTWLQALLALLVVPGMSTACLYYELNSIHFNGKQTDFSVLPRRGVAPWESNDRAWGNEAFAESRDPVAELSTTRDALATGNGERRLNASIHLTVLLSRSGRYRAALAACRDRWHQFGPDGNLRDRIEILRRLVSNPGKLDKTAAQRYLRALDAYDRHDFARAAILFGQTAASGDGYVAAHSRYQLASLLYNGRKPGDAAAAYRAFLRSYPRSDKAEAGFIMIARCDLLRFGPSTSHISTPRKLTTFELDEGGWALHELIHAYPRSRFSASVPGLRARYALARGDTGTALGIYFSLNDVDSIGLILRGLNGPTAGRVRVHLFELYLMLFDSVRSHYKWSLCLEQLSRLRSTMSETDAHRFLEDMLARPALAAPYFEYRLNHTAPEAKELSNLARLAERLVRANPGIALPAQTCVRIGQVYLAVGQYWRAIKWADIADRYNSGAASTYLRAAALHKLHRLPAALSAFRSILARFPNSPLVHGAREEIALLCEQTHDMSGALDQYFILGYLPDIAYLLDVRMSLAQLEQLVRASGQDAKYTLSQYWFSLGPSSTGLLGRDIRRDLIEYSLAIRYLRVGRLAEAKRAVWSVSSRALAEYRHNETHLDSQFDKNGQGIAKTVDRLIVLQRAIDNSGTRMQRARNMYNLASYLYRLGNLTFYNVPLWMGRREYCFDFNWNKNAASNADNMAVTRYMYQHETYVHVANICLQIAAKYPRSPYAPRALWRAACCEFHLSSFNEWWRANDANHQLENSAAHHMNQRARRYPHNALAHEARKYAWVFLHP